MHPCCGIGMLSGAAPYVSMKVGDKDADVMFVETTACPWNDDFVDAVCIAYDMVSNNLQSICEDDGHVFVKKMRMMGIDPLLGM